MSVPNVTELAQYWKIRKNSPCQKIVGRNRESGKNVICGAGKSYDVHDRTEGQYFDHPYKGYPAIDYAKDLEISLENFQIELKE